MFELIRANQRRSALLVVGMALVLVATGFALGMIVGDGDVAAGAAGLAGGAVLWMLLALFSYAAGDSVIMSLSGGRKIEKADHPVLFNVIEEMCVAAGLAKVPDVYIIDQDAPNAFATGRGPDKASVAVTAGLLERLDRDELQGVIGHELAHVSNRDVLYLMLLTTMAGAIVVMADAGRRIMYWGGGRRRTSNKDNGAGAILLILAIVLMILAPIIAHLLYLAVSRKREYLADACAAQYTRYPEGLASALEKIAKAAIPLPGASQAMAPMYIAPPALSLGSTHPPIEERIRILRAMGSAGGRSGSLADYDEAFRKVTRRAVGVLPLGASSAAAAEAAAPLPPLRGSVAQKGAAVGGAIVAQVLSPEGGAMGSAREAAAGESMRGPSAGMPASAGLGARNAGASGVAAATIGAATVGATAGEAMVGDIRASEANAHIERVRQTTDMLWKLNGRAFVPCACGTTLKVPPAYAGQTIACPHCGAPLTVPARAA